MIGAAYRELCPGIAGRILTAAEVAEADAMRAAVSAALLDVAIDRACAGGINAAWGDDFADEDYRRAAWATVLALLLAPEAA